MSGQHEVPRARPPAPAELLAVAVAVIRPAAEQVRRLRASARSEVATKSTSTDVVTAADRQVERELVARLRDLRPHDTILGEEYGEEPGQTPAESGTAPPSDPAPGAVRWLLDPIDGTVNYLYGIPWYAVSVAAELDGEVVAGVVRHAVDGREWTAAAGEGAWRDGSRLGGSAETALSQALVATGFAYRPERRRRQAEVVTGLIPEVRDIRRLGSAALDLCLAAEGAVDAYYEQGLSPWDHAAGGLIAAEAGLTVAGLVRGASADRQVLVAAPPALFGPLRDRLHKLGAGN